MSIHVFGIRHHGPGCGRSLRAALEALSPDVVLVEGPPEGEEALSLATHEGMRPPVALLIHELNDPRNCSFYPFAEFSPEWQAVTYAVERRVPARFMDLPSAHSLALRARAREPKSEEGDAGQAPPDAGKVHPDAGRAHPDAGDVDQDAGGEPRDERSEETVLREDPIGVLAEAAGFADREQWWDVQVEQRRDATGLFEGILDAMTAFRELHPATSEEDERREAHMRTVVRATEKEGFARIAVVCGAWHAPALTKPAPAKRDAEILKGLPRTKVAVAWVPWTNARLSFRSGYGAGVDSPGWYAHLFRHGENAPLVWATLAARLLREQDLEASSANVIETVRLAEALASMRELPAPGLTELREAIEAVLSLGERARMALIRSKLEIGDALGQVPDEAGKVPLARDFEQEVKRLRLKMTAADTPLDLDLRKEIDRDRSRLLYRLQILGVPWGKLAAVGKGAGTFREGWRLAWTPELAVELVAANMHGHTVDTAAVRVLGERAKQADLGAITQLVESAILAHLPAVLDLLLSELDDRAAGSSDVRAQMLALEPLSRVVRYGDVRETRADHILPVVKALFERIIVGLLPSCTQLDDDAAAALVAAVNRAHGACLLLDDAAIKSDWLGALGKLLDQGAAHPRIRGRACRLLLEQGALAAEELERRAGLALGAAVDPAHAAQWIEGLVAGEGALLVHQEELLFTLDAWLAALTDDAFQAQLPLLRRAFSELQPAERRAVADRVKNPQGPGRKDAEPTAERLDEARVSLVVPVLARVLGVSHD